MVYDSNQFDLQTWSDNNKNNNLLIIGFKKFIEQFPTKIKLFLSEWGPDLNSPKLISDLSIKEYVEWLPLLPRSNISYILSKYAQLELENLLFRLMKYDHQLGMYRFGCSIYAISKFF